jgi:aconitate hydratase 2/2-methylisocitrate dehydratase
VLDEYQASAAERAALGIPPAALTASDTREVIAWLECADGAGAAGLLGLLADRVSPGVDEAAQVKADWLASVARGDRDCQAVSPAYAVRLLGKMGGGYNVAPLIELLGDGRLGRLAAEELGETLLVFDAFHDAVDLARRGNSNAEAVLNAWASGTWFSSGAEVPPELHVTVFRVPGETNTDDLSPAPHAWSRGDIPLHALTFLENRADVDDPVNTIRRLRAEGRPVAFVGDVVGTGSSRKSAVNSLLWHMGDDIPHVPNKRRGGVVLAGRIAPIFFNTLEDAGALPIECDVSTLRTGDHIVVRPADGRIESSAGDLIAEFSLRPDRILDSVRAGGRVPLTVGKMLTDRARRVLGLTPSELFVRQGARTGLSSSYTLAQKIVGRACGVEGVAPGTSCEPAVSTVGSQDTTGPMNRNELEDLACLGFSADLVLQTFCHTAAYPKAIDIATQTTLPDFMRRRGAVVLRPGDGIIHSWLNRMLLPDQVGTGSDSHTRFPLGISFPAGSGLVAFAAAFGVMPIDMPESVLVRFHGELQPGVTLRDLVNAIPYTASRQGLLASGRSDRHARTGVGPVGAGGAAGGGRSGSNVFSGRIIEIEGLEDLSVEEAFELSDSTAERSAAACTIALSEASVARYLRSNVVMLRWLIDAGYEDARSLERRAQAMEGWLADPVLLRADPDARYAAVVDIDARAITEPLLACPSDPDDIRTLSEVSGRPLDEVFIGSCMTNIGHFRAASALLSNAGGPVGPRLWIAPPTRMDQAQLRAEGCYAVFAAAGARTEIPGCSLCMGNQATVAPGSTVVSTSTRNFPNRMGRGADVFLASAELAAVAAIEGRLPTVEVYRERLSEIDALSGDIYRYLEFDKIPACAGGPAKGG